MTIHISNKAEQQLDDMPADLRTMFMKHLRKINSLPPRKHMKHGIPCYVEKVTKQARLVYYTENEDIYVTHCFKEHKEYERWYKTYND
ncbi:MAG: hypothetical protein FJY77_01780 [Candidatus Altiarchaeales archaeon]|nr:hypothetical protein [Candidatus Altiarchaeales archaeon]